MTLGDVNKGAFKGLFKDLRVFVVENYLHVNAYILEIGGIDMIFGMEWLETLGDVKTNWKRKVMSFQHGDRMITLKGYQLEIISMFWHFKKSYTRRIRLEGLINLGRQI